MCGRFSGDPHKCSFLRIYFFLLCCSITLRNSQKQSFYYRSDGTTHNRGDHMLGFIVYRAPLFMETAICPM